MRPYREAGIQPGCCLDGMELEKRFLSLSRKIVRTIVIPVMIIPATKVSPATSTGKIREVSYTSDLFDISVRLQLWATVFLLHILHSLLIRSK